MDDPRNADVLVYVNGDFFRRDEARISVFDSGFALGDGVWEGLRLVNGKLISLEAHLDRLFEGAGSIALNIGPGRDGIRTALVETISQGRTVGKNWFSQ